jgi:outer membrane protein assembly factor BamE
MKLSLKNILLLFISIFIASCSIPKTYEVVISQGNLVDQEMMDKLEVGMTESQVKFVMGSPLISDTFYPNRWDYFTSVTQGSKTFTEQKISLYFEDNKLARWEGELISDN